MIFVDHTNGGIALRAECYNCKKVSKNSIELHCEEELILNLPNYKFQVSYMAALEGWEVYGWNLVCEHCSRSRDIEVFAIEGDVTNYLQIGHIMKNQSGGIIRRNGEQYEFWNGSTWVAPNLPPGLRISLNLFDKWRIVHPEELEDKQ